MFFKMQDISEEKRVTLERSEEGGLGISIQVRINHIIIIYYDNIFNFGFNSVRVVWTTNVLSRFIK